MKKKNLNIQIDIELLERYKKYCKKQDISMSREIREFIRQSLKSEDK